MPFFATLGSGASRAFGRLRSAGGVNLDTNAGKYAVVPYHSSLNTSPNTFLMLNTDTSVVDYSVTFDTTGLSNTGNLRILRFGNFLITVDIYGNYVSRNILTNTSAGNGALGVGAGTTGQGDAIKFGTDKLAFIYGVASSNTIQVKTYNVVNGVPSQISSFTIASVAEFREGFSSPQVGAQVTLNADAVFSSFQGRFAFNAVYSWIGNGPTVSYYAVASLNAAGTSCSISSAFTDGNNFSRPVGASGDNGYCLISQMDMGSVAIQNGASVGSFVNGGGNGSTSYAPCAIHGSSGEYMIDNTNYNYGMVATKLTTSGTSTSLTISTSGQYGFGSFNSYGTMQTIKGGCVWVYSDDNVGLRYRKYTRSSDTWSGATAITGYSSGSVNYNKNVKKVNNY
jgi:hypothetical protein